MGAFTKQITLRGTATNAAEPPAVMVDELVDPGALFSSAPADVLERLGATPVRSMPARFADGALRDVPIGEVEAEIDGQRMRILCFFGAKDVPALLGAPCARGVPADGRPDRAEARAEAFLM